MRELLLLIMATVTLSALGITAIMFISYIRPTADNMTLNTMIIGFLAPTIFSFMSFLKTTQTGKSIDNLTVCNTENRHAIDDLKASAEVINTKLVETSAASANSFQKAASDRATIAVTAAVIAAAAVAAGTKHDANVLVIPPATPAPEKT
jgi:hypothetical protein